MTTKGLLARFANKETVIAAEGYLLELERRGYNKNGSFIPMAVLDHPNEVEGLAREYVHAGSDMCQAFTYYAHREKLKVMNREGSYEELNRTAHALAKKVAQETGTMFCAGFGTTNVYDPNNPESIKKCEELLREQIAISAEFKVDYICLETMWDYGEASIGLKICKEYNIPAVVTIAPVNVDNEVKTFDGYKLAVALKKLKSEGAACVGVNCARGPETIIPIVRELRKEIEGPLACVCLGYRTTADQCTWHRLRHPGTGEVSFPDNLGAHSLGTSDVKWYAQQLKEIGVEYVGFCCGNTGSYTRTLAMELGRQPPAAEYVSDHKEKNMIQGTESLSSKRYTSDLGKFFYG